MNCNDMGLRFLIVDDDTCDRKAVIRHLKKCMPSACIVESDCLEAAREHFNKEAIDFVIADYHLPDGSGIELIEHVLKLSQFVPVILLTGQGDEELAVEALQRGACDYLNKDKLCEARILQAIENSIERRNMESKIYNLAHYDQLTRLFNRAHFDDRLRHAFSRAERYGSHLAVMFLDLDKFKEVNDQYGHDMGDAILLEVAGRLKKCVRDVDTLARIGGDEFAIILEDLTEEYRVCCLITGQRIIHAIHTPFYVNGVTLRVGISVGIAIHSNGNNYPDALLKLADEAMYEAKQAPDREHMRVRVE